MGIRDLTIDAGKFFKQALHERVLEYMDNRIEYLEQMIRITKHSKKLQFHKQSLSAVKKAKESYLKELEENEA